MGEYRRYNDIQLEVFSDSPFESGNIHHGRGLLNAPEGRFTFVKAPPRGNRNKLVVRSKHFTLMSRPDGTFSGIFHFDLNTKYVESNLVAEVRNMIEYATKFSKE